MNKTRMSTILLSTLLLLSCCLSLNVKASSFNDVSDNSYYYDAIQWAIENGITNGMGDGTFGVNQTVTRAQAVTFLWRAAGQPSAKGTIGFVDVSSTHYAREAIQWAVENGITNGMGDNLFSPDGPVTRGQMITFLWRVKGEPGKVAGEEWYEGAERWAQQKGIIHGTAKAYSTNANCPRQDVVYYLFLELNNTSSSSGGSTGSNGGSTQTGSNNGSTSHIYDEYGGYEGYIDHLYKMYNGKYTKDQLRKAHPDQSNPGHVDSGGYEDYF